jgi:hypothetical protein
MTKVPVGVAILGLLALLQGIVAAFFGIVFLGVVAFGPAVVGDGIALGGALSLLVGICYIAVAGAAWTLQPWAWLFGEIIAIIPAEAIFLMLAPGSVVRVWLPPPSGRRPRYLNRAEIKAAFSVEGAEATHGGHPGAS